MRSRDQTFLDPFQSANRIGHWLPLLILLSFLSSISSFSNGGVSTKIPFQFVGDSSGIEFEHRNGMQMGKKWNGIGRDCIANEMEMDMN